jgi:hypothetical protein
VESEFYVTLYAKDIALFYGLHPIPLHKLGGKGLYFYGVGRIHLSKVDTALYVVGSLKDITNIIIPHFMKYPLLTPKWADFGRKLSFEISCRTNE